MTIWITGCTNGLGKALVAEYVAAGHKVVGGARSLDRLAKLRDQFPEATFLELDVSDSQSAKRFARGAFDASGEPDFLINGAAVNHENAPLWKVRSKEFERVMSVNVCGVANMIRHVVPIMITAGKGIVVNMSSGWGRSTSPEVAPYCASKWAIEGLTQALAQELPEGLAAIPLDPGVINTRMLRTTFGLEASYFPNTTTWARSAAPFILGLSPLFNGKAMSCPQPSNLQAASLAS